MPIKILQITHKPAYPGIDGGCLEMGKMASFYLNHPEFDLSTFTLSTYKHPFIKEEFEKAGFTPNKIETIEVNTKPTIWGGIKALLSGKSFNLSRFNSVKVRTKLSQILQENEFDVIQFESIFSAQLWQTAKANSSAKLVLNAPNIEHELWKQYTRDSRGFKTLVFRYLAGKLKSEEIKIWKKMDAIFCITKQLEKSLVSFVSLKTKVLTFFVNNTLSSKRNTEKNHLSYFHIGAMDWKPNKEGVDWFVHEVWNSIYSSSPLHLAGKASEKNLFPNKNIEEHGFVPDANEFIQSHDVMIVPLLQGSGMRIKIIEAMALGKCVISTSIGAEGIAATPNKNILIANTADEFKRVIDFLNTNPNKAYEIGERARELVKEQYSAQVLEKEILPFINSILTLEK